jgi:hypothetical protein
MTGNSYFQFSAWWDRGTAHLPRSPSGTQVAALARWTLRPATQAGRRMMRALLPDHTTRRIARHYPAFRTWDRQRGASARHTAVCRLSGRCFRRWASAANSPSKLNGLATGEISGGKVRLTRAALAVEPAHQPSQE